MKVLVLGGCGRQGSVVANCLSQYHKVKVADLDNDADIVEDLTNYKTLRKIMPKFDMVVSTLPSVLGMKSIMAAIDAGVNYVDMSFMEQDVSTFNGGAMKKKITAIHDCGIAPGISNMIAGKAISLGADEIEIYVGGFAASEKDDYVITWHPEDLHEEYTRKARIIIDGNEKLVPALSGQSKINIFGVGKLDTFYTDGLRSLLSKKDKVKNMIEKTVRWPGHVEKVLPLLNHKNFGNNLKRLYPKNKKDVVVLRVVARWSERHISSNADLVVYGDDKMTAMAKTTALSCAAFAQLVADGNYKRTGVIPPEDVALDDFAYRFVLDKLSNYGIRFNEKYPFEGASKCL